MKRILIVATRVTPDGKDFHEEIVVPATALVPLSVAWFTAMVPALSLEDGMIIQCNSDDFLLVDSVSIVDSDYEPSYGVTHDNGSLADLYRGDEP